MSSVLRRRRGVTLAGMFSVALLSVALLCGAGSAPIENLLPQGAMQGDLNAGGHNLTNAAAVYATNVVVSGSLTAPSSFTLPFSKLTSTPTTLAGYGITDPIVLTSGSYANPSWLTGLAYSKLTGAPTLGTLAAVSPGGTPSATTFLKYDGTTFSYATPPGTTTSGTALLYGNGSGGFSNATVGGGLSFSGGTLAANVTSVAGRSGAIVLTASDVSGLATVATSGSYNDLSSKPTIPAAQVNSDWNASSGVAQILNKPTIPAIASTTAVLKGNGSGGAAAAVAGTDYPGLGTANNFAVTQAAASWEEPTGPVNVTLAFSGDSRLVTSGSSVTASGPNVYGCGYVSCLPARLQEMGFGYNALALNLGLPSSGIEAGVSNYANAGITTTGNITSGSMTVTITGSTTGLSAIMTGNGSAVGGPGIPPGLTATISGSTVTLHDFSGLGRTPTLTTSGATLNFAAVPSVGNAGPYDTYLGTAHELSPAVNAATYTCTVTSGSATITLNSGTWGLAVGATIVSTHFSGGGVTVVSSTATTAVVSATASGSGSTEAVTVTPPGLLVEWYGINDVQTVYTGGITSSTSSPVLTGFSNLLPVVPGYAVSGTNIPAGTTVVSSTATTLTLSANPTASSSSNGITITPVASAWETAYQGYVTGALADGWSVEVMTIPKAWVGTWLAGDSFRTTFNAWLISTYGTETAPLVSGVKLCDVASLGIFGSYDPTIYIDGLHLTALANSIVADHVNAVLEAQYPGWMVGHPLIFPQNGSIPTDWVQPYQTLAVGTSTRAGSVNILNGGGSQTPLYMGGGTIKYNEGGPFWFYTSGSNIASLPTTIGGTIPVIPSAQTTVNGSTSGTVTFSQPLNEATSKQVLVVFSGYCSTNSASYTPPTAFTHTPDWPKMNSGADGWITATTTTITVPATSGATNTGVVTPEGY